MCSVPHRLMCMGCLPSHGSNHLTCNNDTRYFNRCCKGALLYLGFTFKRGSRAVTYYLGGGYLTSGYYPIILVAGSNTKCNSPAGDGTVRKYLQREKRGIIQSVIVLSTLTEPQNAVSINILMN